jgi:hypothetical protein
MMRKMMLILAAGAALTGCSMAPAPLVPDAPDGPTSYICYSPWTTSPEEVRAIAERQCARSGMRVNRLIGQSWAPMKCGPLTPEVAGFSCGNGFGY